MDDVDLVNNSPVPEPPIGETGAVAAFEFGGVAVAPAAVFSALSRLSSDMLTPPAF
jgi:hypothetical protein